MAYEQRQTILTSAGEVDLGLQAHMRSVYNTMGLGLVVTGLTAFGIAQTPALFNFFFSPGMMWVSMLAPLAFIFLGFTPSRIARTDAPKLKMIFTVFCAVMGISMAAVFQAFTGESIARVFFITAGTFAATSLYGYTTKRDLTKLGSFMFMGMIGIFFASIANFFAYKLGLSMQSGAIHFAISVIGVVVFTGLAAWRTQNLKESYAYGHGAAEANAKLAFEGALLLYLSFINLFHMLLNLTGERE